MVENQARNDNWMMKRKEEYGLRRATSLQLGKFSGVESVTHCGQLILRKISKFDATRCQILKLECTKFDLRWRSAPDFAEWGYSTPQTP